MNDAIDLLSGASASGVSAVGVVPAVDDEVATLRHDVACVLLQFTRDRGGSGHAAAGGDGGRGAVGSGEGVGLLGRLTEVEAAALAAGLAPLLARRIGGRYVPKVFRAGSVERDLRDAAVLKKFNGRNREEVLREFRISRRLFYSILARRPRGASSGDNEWTDY